MKHRVLLLLSILMVTGIFAQETTPDDDLNCVNKCSRSHLQNRVQQVTYFQYPSMDKYDLKYLKLDLEAEANSRVIIGTALTVSVAKASMDSFITEFRNNMTVDSVFINGVKKIFTRAGDHVFVQLLPAIPAGTQITTLVYYRGTANGNGVFAGTVGSNGLTYTATLSESYQAREWFPIKQFLRDKIDSADIWVTTSAVNKVGSNGLLQGVDAMPLGKLRYRWKTTYPMNYYMPSIAIGNYMEYLNYAKPIAMAPDSILIQHYVVDNATYFNSVKTNIDKTPPFIEKYSDLFGLYPFKNEKYGHAHANIGGGMEHQTMSTMAGFGSTLIAHELGHQWWGDNVTCARWNDIWLNEGFASYCEYLAIEQLPLLFPTTNAPAYMQSVHSNVLSSPTGTVYVPDASLYDEGRIFSGRLSYNKGSAIIHTLRFEMQNDNLFFQTLQNYQTQFKDSTATTEDFKQVAETTTGRSFTDYLNQWCYGEGYPTFNITYYKPNANSLLLLINENVSAPTITPFFKGYLELTLETTTGDTTVLVNLASNNQIFSFTTPRVVTNIIVDPNNWILNLTGIISSGTVVPVRFTDVKAIPASNCSYNIEWKTEQEQNINRYEIEYSYDGSLFTKAGTMPANNSALYRFLLEEATGATIHVRIRSIDNNGQSGYSKVILLTAGCDHRFSATILPNPVDSKMEINILSSLAGKTTIRLINASGQLIRQQNLYLLAGSNNIKWRNLDVLSPGIYLVQVQNEKGNIILKKVVKQ